MRYKHETSFDGEIYTFWSSDKVRWFCSSHQYHPDAVFQQVKKELNND